MLTAVLIALAIPAAPTPPQDCTVPEGPVLLVVTAADPALARQIPAVDQSLRQAMAGRLSLVGLPTTRRVLEAEGGQEARTQTILQAQLRMKRAFEQFRSLDDRGALSLAAEVTAQLSAVSQSPGAVELLAEAHLLAGAIFLARGRIDAAQARLRRALQLAPNLSAPPDRYAPRVRTELAALRDDPGPLGILVVETAEAYAAAEIFVDGRSRGPAPQRLTDIAMGRHLVRVSAPGRLSFHTTVRIERNRPAKVRARLPPDPEAGQLARIPSALRRDETRDEMLDMLTRRSLAEAVIIAEIRLDALRSHTATGTLAVSLHMRARPPQTTRVDRNNVRRGLDALLQCEPSRPMSAAAPAVARMAVRTVDLRPGRGRVRHLDPPVGLGGLRGGRGRRRQRPGGNSAGRGPTGRGRYHSDPPALTERP